MPRVKRSAGLGLHGQRAKRHAHSQRYDRQIGIPGKMERAFHRLHAREMHRPGAQARDRATQPAPAGAMHHFEPGQGGGPCHQDRHSRPGEVIADGQARMHREHGHEMHAPDRGAEHHGGGDGPDFFQFGTAAARTRQQGHGRPAADQAEKGGNQNQFRIVCHD